MDLVLSNGQTVENTWASGTTVNNTERVCTSTDTEKREEELGTKEKESIGLILVLENKLSKNLKTKKKNDYYFKIYNNYF